MYLQPYVPSWPNNTTQHNTTHPRRRLAHPIVAQAPSETRPTTAKYLAGWRTTCTATPLPFRSSALLCCLLFHPDSCLSLPRKRNLTSRSELCLTRICLWPLAFHLAVCSYTRPFLSILQQSTWSCSLQDQSSHARSQRDIILSLVYRPLTLSRSLISSLSDSASAANLGG